MRRVETDHIVCRVRMALRVEFFDSYELYGRCKTTVRLCMTVPHWSLRGTSSSFNIRTISPMSSSLNDVPRSFGDGSEINLAASHFREIFHDDKLFGKSEIRQFRREGFEYRFFV